jgi:cephalosporin hydroxylase
MNYNNNNHKDLLEYFENNPGRLINKWMHYFEIYERHLSRFRNKEIHVVEIGVNQGGSLQMWKKYFGDRAKIYGVDINKRCQTLEEERIKIIIGNQQNRNFLKKIKNLCPQIDILIDDGGHTMLQQINTFEELFPHLSENAVYICEDLHTSYWARCGGGYRNPKSFIEYSKNLIDQLNAWHSKDAESFQVTDFTRSAYSMHYYDSVLVIEKRKMEKPTVRQTGKRAW